MIHATHQLFIHYTAGTVSVVNGVSRIIMKEFRDLLITRFMGPTWVPLGPTGPRGHHVGPWTLLSGLFILAITILSLSAKQQEFHYLIKKVISFLYLKPLTCPSHLSASLFCILSMCSPLFCGLQLTIDIHLHELGAVDLDFGIKKLPIPLAMSFWFSIIDLAVFVCCMLSNILTITGQALKHTCVEGYWKYAMDTFCVYYWLNNIYGFWWITVCHNGKFLVMSWWDPFHKQLFITFPLWNQQKSI